MFRRPSRLCAVLCVVALTQAAVVFRCDSCARGDCPAAGAGCCGSLNEAEPPCPLCRAGNESSNPGESPPDSPPCRCAWQAKSTQPMTSERAAPHDPDPCSGFVAVLDRTSPGLPGQFQTQGALPRVPIPERPVRILFGVWRN